MPTITDKSMTVADAVGQLVAIGYEYSDGATLEQVEQQDDEHFYTCWSMSTESGVLPLHYVQLTWSSLDVVEKLEVWTVEGDDVITVKGSSLTALQAALALLAASKSVLF